MSRGLALAAAAAALLVSSAVLADAFLVLEDGKTLRGREVRREDDVYVLELEGDTSMTVPAALVVQVGVGGTGGDDETRKRRDEPVAPHGVTYSEPRVLAGPEVEPPRTQDQLAVFGKPAQFKQDVVTPGLRPSYWVPDPDQHNFNPSKWAKGPIDPSWEPTSAFDANKNVMADSASTWQKGVVDSSWVPKDGFAK